MFIEHKQVKHMFKKYLDIFKYTNIWHSEYMKSKRSKSNTFYLFFWKIWFFNTHNNGSMFTLVFIYSHFLWHPLCYLCPGLCSVPMPLRSRMLTTEGQKFRAHSWDCPPTLPPLVVKNLKPRGVSNFLHKFNWVRI